MPVFEIDDSNVMIKLVIRRNVVDGAAVADDGGANGASSNNTASEKQQSTSKELSIVADKPAAKFVAHPANKIALHKSTRSNIEPGASSNNDTASAKEHSSDVVDIGAKQQSSTVEAKPAVVPAKKIASYQEINDCNWNKRFNELLEYKNKYGHWSIPKDYNGSSSLNSWVSFWESPGMQWWCVTYVLREIFVCTFTINATLYIGIPTTGGHTKKDLQSWQTPQRALSPSQRNRFSLAVAATKTATCPSPRKTT